VVIGKGRTVDTSAAMDAANISTTRSVAVFGKKSVSLSGHVIE
jgi:hypothetical protein